MMRTLPAMADEGISPRRFTVRAHLAIQGDGYAVMPGGLTRIPWSSESLIVSLQKGGGSKDTWILADGPVEETSLLASPLEPVPLSRGGGDLPSRVADDLFWLGRYVQRAESQVRIGRSALSRLIDLSPNRVGMSIEYGPFAYHGNCHWLRSGAIAGRSISGMCSWK